LLIPQFSWSSDPADAAVAHISEANASETSASETSETAEQLTPAPVMGAHDYRQIGSMSSRSFVWIIAQLHLFLAAFVLAVPLFVTVIEWIGVKMGDQRYDNMAHEFMKVSMTAYSLTALFGGTLAFALFLLYPTFMGYMMEVFGNQVVYAQLFSPVSGILCVDRYGIR